MAWWLVALLVVASGIVAFSWKSGWAANYRRRADARAQLFSYLRRVESEDLGAAAILTSRERQVIAGKALDELLPAISETDSFQLLQEYVIFYADEFAKYLVLAFSKEELAEADCPWAVNSPHISGQLKDYLVDWFEIAKDAADIRTILQEHGTSVDNNDVLCACQTKFAQSCILFNAANVAVEPFEPMESRETDWRTPLLVRLAAFHEDSARAAIGLPSLQDAKDVRMGMRVSVQRGSSRQGRGSET